MEEAVGVVVKERRPLMLAGRERRDEELDDGKGEEPAARDLAGTASSRSPPYGRLWLVSRAAAQHESFRSEYSYRVLRSYYFRI
ncbi:hypothetical protein VTN77DRAFT_9104 [Rasamsonia byssochlamydoides]|uniref:uncharacterized protein n=1 Tax=Rasamsonia byssochlamydoides TaxID=89139 RepID=UPI003743A960